MTKSLRIIAHSLVFLLAIVFSMKQLIEPDLWWQLRTGEWILQTKSIPRSDFFSFTYQNAPWQNVKWGFEVLIALLSHSLGIEMIMLVQIVCSCILVYLLLKLTDTLAPQHSSSLSILIVGTSFIALEYRITGRSESISHVFFLIVCLLLLQHRTKASSRIWWIPVVMMCWVNLHEAYAMGLLTLILVTGISWLEVQFTKTQPKSTAVTYSAVTLTSLVAMCLNPYHVHILLKPLEIAQQVYNNKYTSELSTYKQAIYWTKEAWITLTILILTGIIICLRILKHKTKQHKWQTINEVVPIPYAALAFTLIYIASTGHRNIIFATLVLIPLFITNLSWLFIYIHFAVKDKQIYVLSIAVSLLLYFSVVTNRYYEFWGSKHKYGLEVPPDATPIGAANFLEEQQLITKPVFSDYLSSSYLLWRLQPTFKTYIDLRDLEVFPLDHFKQFSQLLSNPSEFDRIDSQYHFASVVLLCLPQIQALQAHLFHHPHFRLAYIDALSCVYVKDSTKQLLPESSSLGSKQPAPTANVLNTLFNPWYAPSDPKNSDQDFPIADYYYSVSAWEQTLKYAQQSMKREEEAFKGLVLIGQVKYQQALNDTTSMRESRIDSALTCIRKALSIQPDYVPALLDMGTISFNNQQYKSALTYLEKACEVEPTNLLAHMGAAEVYKKMAETANTPKNLEKAISHFLRAETINPDNPEILLNLGFLYYRLQRCSDALPYLEKIVDYSGLTELQRSRAREAIQSCN